MARIRKPLTVGILPEHKNPWEGRAPLTPADVDWLIQREIPIEIMSSNKRCYADREYLRRGAKIVDQFKKANFILGIKEPQIEHLKPNNVYMVFSHTTKGQKENRSLLQAFIKRKITLIDYEHIVDTADRRLIYFGRHAGICGMLDALHLYGKRLSNKGIKNPLSAIQHSLSYPSYKKAVLDLKKVGRQIRSGNLPLDITPLIIGITGHGNVAGGAIEVLNHLKPIEVHPKDIHEFIKKKKGDRKQVYKIIFNREEKFRAKDGEGFYFEEYLKYPHHFESNLDKYLPHINLLVHGSYWDKRFPRLVTKSMVKKLFSPKKFRLELIADLSCDLRGAIEITESIGTPDKPSSVYHPPTDTTKTGLDGEGIAVFAVDNLPCEFSKEASIDFSQQLRDYIYQIAAHGIIDIQNHHALPKEIRDAVITQNGKLASRYQYLKKYI